MAAIIKIHAYRVFKQGVPYLQVQKSRTDLSVRNVNFKFTEKRSKLFGEARDTVNRGVLTQNLEFNYLHKSQILRTVLGF